jgi:hypothetical protein
MKKLCAGVGLVLALFVVTVCAYSAEQYHIEERFKQAVKIPPAIIAYLTNGNSADAIADCEESNPHDIFEAKIIELNKSTKAYLVKPKQMCVCGAYYCPMWIFKVKGKTSKLIWSIDGTTFLEVLNEKAGGYKQLKVIGGGAAHGYESLWSWNKDRYSEIYNNFWVWDSEKECRLGEATTINNY